MHQDRFHVTMNKAAIEPADSQETYFFQKTRNLSQHGIMCGFSI